MSKGDGSLLDVILNTGWEAIKTTGRVAAAMGNGAADMVYGPKGAQGSAEIAHALFSGSAYVPYGGGQKPLQKGEVEQDKGGVHGKEEGKEKEQSRDDGKEQRQERGGR